MGPEDYKLLPLAAYGAVEGIFRYYVRPELKASRTWALIGAVVLAHEIICPPGELLSEGADRLISRHPVLPRVAGLLVAGHVLNVLPVSLDPVHRLMNFFGPG